MSSPRLTKLELQITEALWRLRPISIREMQEAFPEKNRPAYTTVQTTVAPEFRFSDEQATMDVTLRVRESQRAAMGFWKSAEN